MTWVDWIDDVAIPARHALEDLGIEGIQTERDPPQTRLAQRSR